MSELNKLMNRYRDNPEFYNVVNCIYDLIAVHKVTIYELRDALFLAQYKFELEDPIAVEDRFMNLIQQAKERSGYR